MANVTAPETQIKFSLRRKFSHVRSRRPSSRCTKYVLYLQQFSVLQQLDGQRKKWRQKRSFTSVPLLLSACLCAAGGAGDERFFFSGFFSSSSSCSDGNNGEASSSSRLDIARQASDGERQTCVESRFHSAPAPAAAEEEELARNGESRRCVHRSVRPCLGLSVGRWVGHKCAPLAPVESKQNQ